MNSSFQISALPAERFAPLFELSDAELAARHHARRVVADASPGYPCRVSLVDAAPGETLLLLPFAHLDVDSPFRASGPIFVRANVATAAPPAGTVPPMFRTRLLSVRAYDLGGMLRAGDIADGTALEGKLAELLADPAVAFVHLHAARNGCYFGRADRAAA